MKNLNLIKFLAVIVMTAMVSSTFAGCRSVGDSSSSSVNSDGNFYPVSSAESLSSETSEPDESVVDSSSAVPSVGSSASSASGSATEKFYTETDKAMALSALPLGSVSIDGGLYKEVIDYWGSFYLNIPNDNILYEFRMNTGIQNPSGKRLGGWSIQLKGYEANEWISGFCKLYAITGNKAYKDKALTLLDEWYKCFERNVGGLMWYNSHYTLKRWVDAFLDSYTYLGNKNALERIDALYTWAKRNLSSKNLFGDNGTEWYTLSETFYQVYAVTKDKKYLDFAKKWEYTEYWNFFRDAKNITPFAKAPEAGMNTEHYHVISHVNSFNGAAEAYRLTKDTSYLNILKNAFTWLKNDQMFSSGTIGAGLEWGMPVDEIMQDLQNNHAHAETGANPCYARYGRNLLQLTGNAQVGDWLENLNYNDLCALLKPKASGVDSIFMSYHDYNLNGGSKVYGWRGEDLAWTSCAATIPLELAGIYEAMYYSEGNNLHVNGYAPSTLNWNRNGNKVKLTQKTAYPNDGKISLTLSLSKTEQFSIRLRIPEWADKKAVSITVNGKTAPVNVNSSGWAVLRKDWKNGDTIVLNLPMKLWTAQYSTSNYAGIMYGPLAMALKAPDFKSVSNVDLADTGKFVSTGNLQYKYSPNSTITLKPYYQYGANETYYYYLFH